MNRRHIIAGLGVACVLAASAWVGREWLGERYWRWQSSGTDVVTLDECEDPGAALLFRVIVQNGELPCAPGEWLPWVEEDLEHVGARRWVQAHLASPLSTPLQRFRLGLAIARTSEEPVPELGVLLGSDQVPSSEREWTRRWLAGGEELPGWADPVVQHGMDVQRFMDGELTAGEWLTVLERSRVAPAAVPSDLRRASVERTVALAQSADPEAGDALPCSDADAGCYRALVDAVDRVVGSDATGWDGGAGELPRSVSREPDTLASGYWRALYGVDDGRVEASDAWIRRTAAWLSEVDPVYATSGQWLVGGHTEPLAPDELPTDPAAVLGARAGTPWGTALAASAVGSLVGSPTVVNELSQVGVHVAPWDVTMTLCEGDSVVASSAESTQAAVVARAAVEAAVRSLADGDRAAAARLAGLAERADPERFPGLVASLPAAEDGASALPIGRRIGRLGAADEALTTWWQARTAEDADVCALWLPPEVAPALR